MKGFGRRLTVGALGGVVSLLAFAALSFADAGPIEPVGITAWNPSSASINTTESVSFKNSSGTPHGVTWTSSGPSSCTNVILNGSGTSGSWEGSCTFNQPGSYPFHCTLHPEMTGTVTVSGTAGPEKPVVTTGNATIKGDTEADLAGTVNPNGQATEYFFEWGLTAGYGQSTDKTAAGSGSTATNAAATLAGLAKSTTYHYRLVAKNETGTTNGADRTLTTSGPPTATTNAPSGVTDTAANLQAAINPGGHPTTYFFEWGTTTAYGTKTALKSAGSGFAAGTFNAPLTGLTASTNYHYKVVAESSAGKVSGLDATFETKSTPAPPPPPAEEKGGGQTTTPPPPPGSGQTPPPPGPALGGVKVLPGKHGGPVKATVEVLAGGAGGKLVVELKTKGKGGKAAGKATKAGLPAGKTTLSVPLNAKAKSTLKSKGRLALSATVTLTPPGGAPGTVTKSVTVTA